MRTLTPQEEFALILVKACRKGAVIGALPQLEELIEDYGVEMDIIGLSQDELSQFRTLAQTIARKLKLQHFKVNFTPPVIPYAFLVASRN